MAVATHIAMYPKTCIHAISLIFTIQQSYNAIVKTAYRMFS